MTGQTVHVLWWKSIDGNGAGIVRCFESEESATSALAMMLSAGDDHKAYAVAKTMIDRAK